MSESPSTTTDVVATADDARQLSREPLIIIEPLEAFLDQAGLASGPLFVTPIGAGHSNVTYMLHRGASRWVLRRPPRGPLPRSTHDVLREARIVQALDAAGVRVPHVLAVCETDHVIGAPFYIMDFIDGHVIGESTHPFLAHHSGCRVASELVDALIEIHAVDITHPTLASFGRPSGYLERQLRRFNELLTQDAGRELPELALVGAWLKTNLPQRSESTVVHGDYRLGNVMFSVGPSPKIAAVLDWEMATLGDPLADVGYLTATWAEPTDASDPMLDLSATTRLPGFPRRNEVALMYAERTGRDLTHLRWYQSLALWKAAIFLETSYRRHLAGSTDDPYFARLREGVPRVARRALIHIRG